MANQNLVPGLGYVEETQKQRLPNLTAIRVEASDGAIAMNAATRRNIQKLPPQSKHLYRAIPLNPSNILCTASNLLNNSSSEILPFDLFNFSTWRWSNFASFRNAFLFAIVLGMSARCIAAAAASSPQSLPYRSGISAGKRYMDGTSSNKIKLLGERGIAMFVIFSLLASMFLGVAGQIFIKKGLTGIGKLDFSTGLVASYVKIFFTPYVFIGIGIYFLGVFFWLYALSKVELSYAFPFVSLSYILVLVFSSIFLREHVTYLRWAGVFLISAGVYLVSRS